MAITHYPYANNGSLVDKLADVDTGGLVSALIATADGLALLDGKTRQNVAALTWHERYPALARAVEQVRAHLEERHGYLSYEERECVVKGMAMAYSSLADYEAVERGRNRVI